MLFREQLPSFQFVLTSDEPFKGTTDSRADLQKRFTHILPVSRCTRRGTRRRLLKGTSDAHGGVSFGVRPKGWPQSCGGNRLGKSFGSSAPSHPQVLNQHGQDTTKCVRVLPICYLNRNGLRMEAVSGNCMLV